MYGVTPDCAICTSNNNNMFCMAKPLNDPASEDLSTPCEKFEPHHDYIPRMFYLNNEDELYNLTIAIFNNEYSQSDGLSSQAEVHEDALEGACQNLFENSDVYDEDYNFIPSVGKKMVLDYIREQVDSYPVIAYVYQSTTFYRTEDSVFIVHYQSLDSIVGYKD